MAIPFIPDFSNQPRSCCPADTVKDLELQQEQRSWILGLERYEWAISPLRAFPNCNTQ